MKRAKSEENEPTPKPSYQWRCPEKGCNGMCLTAEASLRHTMWHQWGMPMGNSKPANTKSALDLAKQVGYFEYVTDSILQEGKRGKQ